MRTLIYTGAFLLASFSLKAQSGGQFTLDAAKEYALTNNLSVKNAYLDIENARKQSLEATSMGLPQVSINGSFSNFLNLPVQVVDASFINPMAQEGETISFRAGTDYSAAGTFQVSQLLFNGSYIVGLQVSKFFVEVSEANARLSEEDILFNVIQAYQVAAVAKENLSFVDSMVVLTEDLINEQRSYFELGLLNQEDLDQLEYSLLTSKNAQTSARIQYENALTLLKLTMGYPMEESLEITENAEQLMQRVNLKDAGTGSIQNNRSLEMLNNQKSLSEYNLKNYKFSQYPTLSAVFQHTYNAYRNEFNFFADEKWFPQTMWGLQLNIPIFSGGQKYAQIQQAKIRILKDENTIKLMEQNLKMQEIQYQNNLLGAQQKLELQKQNIDLAGKIYSNAIVKKEIGNGNSLDVTQKYNQLMIAQSQYVGSLIDVFTAKLNIDKLYNQILK